MTENIRAVVQPLPSLSETDPTGRPAHSPGAKLDAGKAPIRRGVIQCFPRALEAVAFVSQYGAEKYLWDGWRDVPDAIERFGDASERHTIKAAVEGIYDQDSGLLHQAHKVWNELAVLEKMLEAGVPLRCPVCQNPKPRQ